MPRSQPAYVTGEVLKWARESINLDPEEAAERLDVPPDRLARWEAGSELPTIAQAREIASVYKRPLAAFFLPKPPLEFHVPHDFRRRFGAPPRRLSPDFLTEYRKAHYLRSLAVNYADEPIGLPGELLGTVLVEHHPEEVGEKVRKVLGITAEDQFGWRDSYQALNAWKDAVEKAGTLVFHFTGVEVEEVRGFSICERSFPVIGVNGKDWPNGRIFSLLHEFGHLLLGNGGDCDCREYDHYESPDQQTEVFCNYVAGAALVPKLLLEQHEVVRAHGRSSSWEPSKLAQLADVFHVSPQVILRRLLIVGKTTRDFYRAKQQELDRTVPESPGAGFLPVPRRVIRALGQPLLRIILNAYYREAITSSDLAEYLGVRLKHLPEIESLLSGPNVLTGGDR
jgi:Zn-dependent peptidase ImmA (M78 family)/transcriptional regulator with XRE-family HTH domain